MSPDGGLLILMLVGPPALVLLGITALLERFTSDELPGWVERLFR